jgi:hypothetical protein
VPDSLRLPKTLRVAGWKVKIQEKETVESPHVAILRRTQKWRLGLRDHQFMDPSPDPSFVPEELLSEINRNWNWLCSRWNRKYPHNPV